MLHNDCIIGMGALKKIASEVCEIKRLFFKKSFRGKGLGRRMLIHLLRQAAEVGYLKIRLTVYNSQQQAAQLSRHSDFFLFQQN